MGLKRIAISALAVISLAACQISDSEYDNAGTLTFRARNECHTVSKTIIQPDGAIFWSPGDRIKVFCGQANGMFISDNKSDASEALFHGSLGPHSGTYWAIYPYSEDTSFDGSCFNTSLPEVQEAVAGTYKKELFGSIARSDDENLHFFNVFGGVRFTVSREGIRSVTLKGNNGEVLAGTVSVGFGSNGTPEIKSITEGKKEITLKAPQGESFLPGKWYYIVTVPTSLTKGYTLSFEAPFAINDKTGSSPVDISRSAWGSLTEADPYEVNTDFPENCEYEAVADTLSFNITADGPWSLEVESVESAAPATKAIDDFVTLSVTSGGSGVIGVEVGLSANYSLVSRSIHLLLRHQHKVQRTTITQRPRIYVHDGTLTIALLNPNSLESSINEAGTSKEAVESLRLLGTMGNNDWNTLMYMPNLRYLDARRLNENNFRLTSQCLEYLYLPDQQTDISSSALTDNRALKYIYGAHIEKIGYRSLGWCSSLEDCYFPEVREIEGSAFMSCTALKALVFPKLIKVEGRAFYGCDAVSTVSFDSLEILPNSVLNDSGPVNVETLNLPSLITAEDSAFKGLKKLKTLELPKVKQIGYMIISGSSIETINFPKIESLPESAFASSENLRDVYFEDLKSVGNYAFQSCEKLKNVYMPHAEVLGDHAFYNSTLGGDLDFSSVTVIGDNCFERSTGIGSDVVRFPLVVNVGNSAFHDCVNLTVIEMPIVSIINSQAFYNCSKLYSVGKDNKLLLLTTLGNYAFYGCSSLPSLNFPILNNLGNSCFNQSGLGSLAFGNLPWKEVNEYGFALPPFDYFTFPIDDETSSHISLMINGLESPINMDNPWWDTDWDGKLMFMKHHWAGVSRY